MQINNNVHKLILPENVVTNEDMRNEVFKFMEQNNIETCDRPCCIGHDQKTDERFVWIKVTKYIDKK